MSRSVAEANPLLARQAHGWDPTTVKVLSNRRLEWRCDAGHTWKAIVSSRSHGTGCPYCTGHLPIVGETDLATTHPELAAQAYHWDPTTVAIGSGKKKRWRCERGHVWIASPSTRLRSGCPYCAGVLVIPGETDLATLYPELAAQADGWDPTTVTARTGQVRPWRCEKGHTWRAVVASRTRGAGCPECHRERGKVFRGYLSDEFPELAAQADGWDPTTVTAGSSKRLPWRCPRGHTWSTRVKGRTLLGTGCPYCSGRLPIVGETDLATLRPDIAAEAYGWDPTTVTVSSGRKMTWKCSLGHVWVTTVASRSQSTGCPSCFLKRNHRSVLLDDRG